MKRNKSHNDSCNGCANLGKRLEKYSTSPCFGCSRIAQDNYKITPPKKKRYYIWNICINGQWLESSCFLDEEGYTTSPNSIRLFDEWDNSEKEKTNRWIDK